jgi:glycerol-3-phosphate acyltransferase PlsY
MEIFLLTAGILIAYLLGAVPTAVWFGKLYHGIDVREHGSGNPGATNTFRVLGKRAGTIVLLIDVVKGLMAASLPVVLLKLQTFPENELVNFKIIFGLMAVVGHLFPVFLSFKGGKGVATLMGMMLAIHYEVAILSAVIFMILLFLTKYVSLSSIIGALSFPFMLLLIPRFQGGEPMLIIFGFILFVVILVTHNRNIHRMFKGEENKTHLFNRKNNQN